MKLRNAAAHAPSVTHASRHPTHHRHDTGNGCPTTCGCTTNDRRTTPRNMLTGAPERSSHHKIEQA